jgi:hypothetical protein
MVCSNSWSCSLRWLKNNFKKTLKNVSSVGKHCGHPYRKLMPPKNKNEFLGSFLGI